MASIINASSTGSGGIVQTADASGVLQLQTNGTVSLQVDTSANVGIGTTSANGYKLAIGDGASSRGRIYLKGATGGNYPEINIDDTMNSSGKNYQLYSTGGVLKVSNQTDSAVSFVANAFGIGLADNAPVDGDGIRFPATQSASTDANTLDDYEEGTWTPTLGGNTTYTSQYGFYRKIGSLVFVSAYLKINAIGTGSTTIIDGLPFNPLASGSQNECVFSLSKCDNLSVSVVSISLRNNGTTIYATYRTASSASSTVNSAYITNGTELNFSGCYIIF